MSEPDPPAGTAPEKSLRRALGLRDLVLFNVVAVMGLRWLATSAHNGPSAIALWLLAGVMFFVPQGLVVIELASRFPQEGGIYNWTKRALGEKHGYMCGWCYWINNVLYYPNLLISTAAIATYVVGRGNTTLKDDPTYVLTATVICLWVAVFVNILGVGTGRWLQNAGGLGTYVPGLVLIVLGAIAFLTGQPSANAFTRETVTPDLGHLSGLNLWSNIAFAFAGLELSSALGGEVRDPRRTLPRAVLIAAPLIAVGYILGTTSVLWLVPQQDVNIVSGFLQAISVGADAVSPHLWWLAAACAAAYTIGNIGGVGAWLTGPARVALVIGLDRYFPPAFGRIHPRWKTPYVAILVQAVLATAFLFISKAGKDTTIEKAYLILLDTQLIVYFIPYVYLFMSYLIHRRSAATAEVVRVPGGALVGWLTGLSGLVMTLLAIVLALIPPADDTQPALFLLKVGGGALGFVGLGVLVYWRAQRRAARA